MVKNCPTSLATPIARRRPSFIVTCCAKTTVGDVPTPLRPRRKAANDLHRRLVLYLGLFLAPVCAPTASSRYTGASMVYAMPETAIRDSMR
jgi:hypothetical protein